MKHSCPKFNEYKPIGFDKPPHHFSSYLKDAPDGDGVIFSVLYMNEEDYTQFGHGIRFRCCPACGERLAQGVL